MIKQPLEEWLKEAEQRFGEDKKKWAFKCPACEKTNTIGEFVELGLDVNKAYSDCIGRHTKEKGCNWAAYGLLGTMGKGRVILTDGGKETEVFDFAPAVESESIEP